MAIGESPAPTTALAIFEPLFVITDPDRLTCRGSGMCIVVASFVALDQWVIVLATGSMTMVWVMFRPPMPVVVVV